MILNISIGLLFNLILICQGASNDGFSFPQDEVKDPAKQNAAHKHPVTNYRCKEGEFLYPGDQEDDWVCDCKPGYIYHPTTNKCYAAYTKGPCKNQEYLILVKPNVIPECKYNQCPDKHVWYKDACHKLNTGGPCPLQTLGNVFEIDETTLNIGCSLGSTEAEVMEKILASRWGTSENDESNGVYPYKACFYGGIRWTNYECPKQNETDTSISKTDQSISTTINPDVQH